MLFKGLTKGMASYYDPSFVYKIGVWNTCPELDTVSKEACGKGLHLCKRIEDVKGFVPDLAFVCSVKYRNKVAEDSEKVRVNGVLLTRIIPWSKLAPLYEDYKKKCTLLDEDYKKKLAPLDEDYEKKLAPLDEDYKKKRAPLDDDYVKKWTLLDEDYEKKRTLLYDDYVKKLRQKFNEEATEL